jgi:predicted DNA-binding transcriptional regulator AlpA
MRSVVQKPLPLTASTGKVTEATGLPGTTLRRLAKTDPTFPKPFTLAEGGDWRWPLAEVVAWLEARAGRSLAA